MTLITLSPCFSFMFWIDLISLFPWDVIVLACMGMDGAYIPTQPAYGGAEVSHVSLIPLYVSVLKWLTLLRMYRVVELFEK